MNQELNHCDHGHATNGEVRLLPYGGGGNIIVCIRHYAVEIAARVEHKKQYGSSPDLPRWEDLKVYEAK